MAAPTTASQRIDGIAWLRAVMSVFVVAWHLGGGGKSAIWNDQYPRHVFTVSDFANFHILLLAVPSFMIISNYLLARSNPDLATAWRRAQRVGVLLAFWPLMLLIFQAGWNGGVVANLPSTAQGWLIYALTAGETIYYFFVSVLITYALTLAALRLPLAVNIVLLILATAATGLAPLVSIAKDWPLLSAYWSPVNFLPYSFVGIVVLQLFDRDAPTMRVMLAVAALVVLGCALAYLEWRAYPHAVFFPGQGFAFPAYTRTSLVALSMALMILAVRWNPGVPAWVEFMAKYSLALYLLHIFMSDLLRPLVTKLIGGSPPLLQAWVLIIISIAASYIAAKVLSLIWKDRLLF